VACGRRSAAEIGALDGRIGLQVGSRVVRDDAAVRQHIAAIGDAQALLRILLDQQQPDALRAHL
jgi:hypothetical protein